MFDKGNAYEKQTYPMLKDETLRTCLCAHAYDGQLLVARDSAELLRMFRAANPAMIS
jgi:hypothetical protein